METKTSWFKKAWSDPVWSKVISAVIVGLCIAIWEFLKGLYNGFSTKNISEYFGEDLYIKRIHLFLMFSILVGAIASYIIKSITAKIRIKAIEEKFKVNLKNIS